jgi:cytochrome c oxidase assembly protein subunit 15
MASAPNNFLRKGFPLLTKTVDNPYAVTGKWILGVAGMVVGAIHVGGVTRLTQSGLSMTTWSATGALPPVSHAEWEMEFARYQTYPEYQQRKNMTLDEFKYIYAWEYGHRMIGRVVGLAFILPLMYFTARGLIPPGYQPRMAVLGTMGASQGIVGWWMVQSGLGEDRRGDTKEIRVKPVRLATHLSLAVATYGALLWTGLDIFKLPYNRDHLSADQVSKFKDALRHASKIRAGGIALTGLTAVTVVSGALVAGNDAGRAYNTFPKMDGRWIPRYSDMFELVPWQRNLIENTATVQWNHRVLGSLTTATALSVAAFGLMGNKAALLSPQARKGLIAVGLATVGQFTLGVTTLLNYVPLGLAAAHQLGSVVVFTSGVYLVHSLRYARPAVLRTAATAAAVRAPKPITANSGVNNTKIA